MAEKEQEHLRIRLGARLLKRIDAAREKTGRTRTDEIEARLQESFTRWDVSEVATMAAREMMNSLKRDAQEMEAKSGRRVGLGEILKGELDE
jgi:hypothetical protein